MRRLGDVYAERLYSRIPAHYRYYDLEQGLPLLALLRVVAEEAANLRQDLDRLWDDFFIETCEDWAVPYIGALVAATLPPESVGQSDRLAVWNAIRWRRSRGTPETLRSVAGAMAGRPAGATQFFENVGWSQHLNHPRPGRLLTPNVRDHVSLGLLGRVGDPHAHAADFKASHPLDAPALLPGQLGVGGAAHGTPGRYQIGNIGIFVPRLQTFSLKGVTPAASPPRTRPTDQPRCLTFDPLFRATPLFSARTGRPISRTEFDHWAREWWGREVAVRQSGVLLATAGGPADEDRQGDHDASPRSWLMAGGRPAGDPASAPPPRPFTFGDQHGDLRLDEVAGMRLLDPDSFQLGGPHFILTAGWHEAGHRRTDPLGHLSTLHAALRDGDQYHPARAARHRGTVVITVEPGRSIGGWSDLAPSGDAYFPGAVLAMRAAREGPAHAADALYAYLPPVMVAAGTVHTYHVADDGSSYTEPDLDRASLARAAEGQVYPPLQARASARPARGFTLLNRARGALRLHDPARFGEEAESRAAVLLEIFELKAPGAGDVVGPGPSPQLLGAIATVDQPAAAHPGLDLQEDWPAFTYVASPAAIDEQVVGDGLLSIRLRTLAGEFIPQTELVLVNRRGQGLLAYLPELSGVHPDDPGVNLVVAADGSTYFWPDDPAKMPAHSFGALLLARGSAGQTLAIEGVRPAQQRTVVGVDLGACAPGLEPVGDLPSRSRVRFGELGVDPELGLFALAPDDPVAEWLRGYEDYREPVAELRLTVDYVDAFGGPLGARPFRRASAAEVAPNRLVSRSGDGRSSLGPRIPWTDIHPSVEAALEAAQDGDVIEIVDSASYPEGQLVIPRNLCSLTLRAAAGQRPCLTSYQDDGNPGESSIRGHSNLDSLVLSGLLVSGGPLRLGMGQRAEIRLSACSLDPHSAGRHGSIVAGAGPGNAASLTIDRCITGGVEITSGVHRLVAADSIIDAQGELAIGGPRGRGSAARFEQGPEFVQLDRVTVLGRIRCRVLDASECLLDDVVVVKDQQAGCLRFSRYESGHHRHGSRLPRRYRCLPNTEQLAACATEVRCLPPAFSSRHFGRPTYGQLAVSCPAEILTASERGGEIGAFAAQLSGARAKNMVSKLDEVLPAGLSIVLVAET